MRCGTSELARSRQRRKSSRVTVANHLAHQSMHFLGRSPVLSLARSFLGVLASADGVDGGVEIALLILHQGQLAPCLACPFRVLRHMGDERTECGLRFAGALPPSLHAPSNERHELAARSRLLRFVRSSLLPPRGGVPARTRKPAPSTLAGHHRAVEPRAGNWPARGREV